MGDEEHRHHEVDGTEESGQPHGHRHRRRTPLWMLGWAIADIGMNMLDRYGFFRQAGEDPKGCVKHVGCALLAFPLVMVGLVLAIAIVSGLAAALEALGLDDSAAGVRSIAGEASLVAVVLTGFLLFLVLRRVYRRVVERRQT